MPNYTRSDLVTQVSELIGDTSNQQWSTSQIQDRLQKAQEKFVSDTRCLRDVLTTSIVAGTSQYALSTETFDVVRVGISGRSSLKKISKFDLDMSIGGDWSTTTGSPSHYYVNTSTLNKHVVLYPIPQDNDAGTDNLIIDYVKVPTVMASGASYALDGQGLLNPYIDGIIFYAAAQILYASNNPIDWQKANVMMKQYEAKTSECITLFNDLSETTPLRLRISGIGRVVNAR
jgi:hypothetical protein